MLTSNHLRTWSLALLLFGLATTASGVTIVPLNTGYKHSSFGPYPAPISGPSNIRDNYWINIASYPTTNPPVGPSYVLPDSVQSWLAPMPNTRWISAWNTATSQTATSNDNPSYTIFRKCFCLLPNFKNASLEFSVRADDTIQVWFNSQLNVALPPSLGNWGSGLALKSVPSKPKWFRPGKNCIYVLLEDIGGHMGFDLSGTIEADGLMPLPAFGKGQRFDCPCRRGDARRSKASKSEVADEKEVIRQLVKIAEKRRVERDVDLNRVPRKE